MSSNYVDPHTPINQIDLLKHVIHLDKSAQPDQTVTIYKNQAYSFFVAVENQRDLVCLNNEVFQSSIIFQKTNETHTTFTIVLNNAHIITLKWLLSNKHIQWEKDDERTVYEKCLIQTTLSTNHNNNHDFPSSFESINKRSLHNAHKHSDIQHIQKTQSPHEEDEQIIHIDKYNHFLLASAESEEDYHWMIDTPHDVVVYLHWEEKYGWLFSKVSNHTSATPTLTSKFFTPLAAASGDHSRTSILRCNKRSWRYSSRVAVSTYGFTTPTVLLREEALSKALKEGEEGTEHTAKYQQAVGEIKADQSHVLIAAGSDIVCVPLETALHHHWHSSILGYPLVHFNGRLESNTADTQRVIIPCWMEERCVNNNRFASSSSSPSSHSSYHSHLQFKSTRTCMTLFAHQYQECLEGSLMVREVIEGKWHNVRQKMYCIQEDVETFFQLHQHVIASMSASIKKAAYIPHSTTPPAQATQDSIVTQVVASLNQHTEREKRAVRRALKHSAQHQQAQYFTQQKMGQYCYEVELLNVKLQDAQQKNARLKARCHFLEHSRHQLLQKLSTNNTSSEGTAPLPSHLDTTSSTTPPLSVPEGVARDVHPSPSPLPTAKQENNVPTISINSADTRSDSKKNKGASDNEQPPVVAVVDRKRSATITTVPATTKKSTSSTINNTGSSSSNKLPVKKTSKSDAESTPVEGKKFVFNTTKRKDAKTDSETSTNTSTITTSISSNKRRNTFNNAAAKAPLTKQSAPVKTKSVHTKQPAASLTVPDNATDNDVTLNEDLSSPSTDTINTETVESVSQSTTTPPPPPPPATEGESGSTSVEGAPTQLQEEPESRSGINQSEEDKVTGKLVKWLHDMQVSLDNKPVLELTTLVVTKRNIESIHADITLLTHTLTSLDFSNNEIKVIPKEITALIQLKTLVMQSNEIEEIPKRLFSLPHLTRLDVSHNEIKELELPEEFEGATALTHLNLSYNEIAEIPAGISRLTALRKLELFKNQIEDIPKEIGALTNLVELYLNENEIEDIPKEISLLVQLRKLNLAKNQIHLIPKELFKLTGLVWLNFSFNEIEKLPNEITYLSKLEELYISNNEMEKLPPLHDLSYLRILNVAENNLPTDIAKRIASKIPNCKIITKQ